MIAIVNGPNLNLLGKREPHIYGHETLEDIQNWLINIFEKTSQLPDGAGVFDQSKHAAGKNYSAGVLLHFFQSNSEGALIDELQRVGFDPDCSGIVFNPGGYSHTSVALRDCIAALPAPVIEVHLSNIHSREDFRHRSLTGAAAKGIITGLGKEGYALAVRYLLK